MSLDECILRFAKSSWLGSHWVSLRRFYSRHRSIVPYLAPVQALEQLPDSLLQIPACIPPCHNHPIVPYPGCGGNSSSPMERAHRWSLSVFENLREQQKHQIDEKDDYEYCEHSLPHERQRLFEQFDHGEPPGSDRHPGNQPE